MPLRLAAVLTAITLLYAATVPSTAQTPAQDTHAGPAIELSTAQRHTIYQSVSKTQKNNAAPTGFRVSVGVSLPPGIELSPLPETLATLMPQARPFAVAMIEKQVVLADPKTRQVAAVITQEEP